MKKISFVDAGKMSALAVIYLIAARLGLELDAVSGFATLVWPASGIALAAIVLLGYRVWPGVFAGAFVANLLVGAPPLVAALIGAGNSLEALLGGYALRSLRGFRPALDRIRDVLTLIILAAALSTIVSATIGVGSLYASGIVAPELLVATWRAWWIGDVIGDLLVAPLILIWATSPRVALQRMRLLEAAALFVSLVLVGALTFFQRPLSEPAVIAQTYMIFPVLIWAALRFGPRGAASAAFVVAILAVWGTALGRGPFALPVLHESLLGLQVFMGVAAATFLLLAAAMAERREAVRAASEARAQAEAANLAKSEFLAVMSHELRTPLNAISGYVELLTLGTHGPLNQAQIDVLARVRRNQQHLLALIEDILSFARLEAGHIEVKPNVVNVAEVVDAVESILQPEMLRRQIALARQSWDAGLSVCADPAKLRQILVNLLSNAVKFSGDGGQVELGAHAENGRVQIVVRDSGIGIPQDQLDLVFNPFFQVESGTTRRYTGVGLGLTIARDLAREMHGDVLLESRLGEGTTASVVLPAA